MEILNEKPVKKTKRLTSVVWNHFERIRKADAQYAVCVHCKKKLSGSSNSGTTHLRNHLLRCLKRSNYDVSQILSSKRKRKETNQSPLRPCNASVAMVNYEEGKIKDGILSPIPLKFNQDHKKEETCQTINLGSVKFDQERSWFDLARMIMLHGYPMTMVDHVGFKIFVKNLQPMFEIKEYGSVELDCLTIYAKEKQNVYETLQHLHGRINLSVSMWGGAYGSEYICLTANYIDEDWRLQKRMLNFQAPDLSNSDDMLSGVVIKSLTDWRIRRKLFSITFDDTAAYELMVFKIKDWLAQDGPLLRNGELSYVLCITHLLKSIAQEIIEECWELICKIRASIKHVKGSEVLFSEFNKIAQGVGINSCRRPVLDYPMQWDSTYMMLEAACQYRSAFSLLQEHDPSYLKMALSETEWDWASSIAGCMKSILEFTNVVIGNNYPCANIFFPEMCDMHLQLIEWTKSPDDFLRSIALKMKYKFDIYWRKCSLILAVAAILDPRFKMKLVEYYFQQIYGTTAPDRILEVSARLRELFHEYSTLSSSPHQDSESDLGRGSFPRPSSSSQDKLKGFDKFLYETSQSPSMSSDLDIYLQEPVFPRNCDFSILNWWKVHVPRYPILSMMARDILAIPVSTLAPDVVFSSSDRILDRYHSSLNPDIREALLCGQDWLRTETEAGNLSSSTFPLPLRT